MAIYALKPAFRRALSPVGRRLVRAGVPADAVTLSGVVFAGLGGLGVWLGRAGSGWLLLVPAAALGRLAANALDGWIAEQTGTARPLGEVLNETADRVADVALFLPVALVPAVPPLLVAAALAVMLTAAFVGVAVKAAGGRRLYDGVMGKPDRMLVLSAAAIAGLVVAPGRAFQAALWVVIGGGLATIVQRAVIGRRALT